MKVRSIPYMKKRSAFIAALLSLIPFVQTVLTGTGVSLMISSIMLVVPEKAQAESATFYINRGDENLKNKNYYGAISDFRKAIAIDSEDPYSFYFMARAKQKLGDMKGACSDLRKASSLGDEMASDQLKELC